ncbi:LPXTG cell wall anchor domain-containing protein [Streptomyces dangxiongensis]|uniref:LPXTG cell wall anchor domain-containing protein n=1 Tax=Streptomyces dangxiongensis TaxID=1442032 RepID=A0A3G2JHX1_9ACTN|nr:SCO1860 family LAETG-anchored protein [Streptomyces dangxiongensis]AYN42010.1 LPXTG cell wall anchor domain-containing protein [Streptomyces dangxiongensis]
MNSNSFRMPARRLAALATVAALTAAPAVLGAGAAHATGGHGRASAVVLRTGLDVSLLAKSVHLPLALSLDEVRAPRSADRTALSARLDGVNGGRPFTVLDAEVARTRATATARRAEGSVRVAHARLHVPGLPLLSVIEADAITARATCEAGTAPTASADVLGAVTVLGKRVTLTAGGPVQVKVPGVGEVRLDLAERRTTTRTAAATALQLKVSVTPLKLDVADVEGTVTLAEATCESPAAPPARHPVPSHDPAADVRPQGAPAEAGLAETGGSPATPYIAGGALALLLAGGGAVALTRRRKS